MGHQLLIEILGVSLYSDAPGELVNRKAIDERRELNQKIKK